MALADLTGNGLPDIVVDYADQNIVSVLLNNGDGTFQAPRDYAVGPFLRQGTIRPWVVCPTTNARW